MKCKEKLLLIVNDELRKILYFTFNGAWGEDECRIEELFVEMKWLNPSHK